MSGRIRRTPEPAEAMSLKNLLDQGLEAEENCTGKLQKGWSSIYPGTKFWYLLFYPLYSIQLIIIALVFTLQSEPQKAYLDISKTHKH